MDESVRLRPRQQSSSSENNTTHNDISPDDSLSSDSNWSSDSTNTTGLSSEVIRVLSDSLLRTELAEMEMIKAREAARWEAEKRRMEMEVELTQMVFQTHLQATTSLLHIKEEQKISPSRRKRKRSKVIEDESSSITRDKSLALLSLLQLNLIFSNSLT